jgi:hypothetical protein
MEVSMGVQTGFTFSKLYLQRIIEDVPLLRERDGQLVTVVCDLDSKKVVYLAEIRDWEVFCELPLKPDNLINGVADEAEVIDMGENNGEVPIL